MKQKIRNYLNYLRVPGYRIAIVAGIAPLIVAVAFMFAKETLVTSPDRGWTIFLVQHQDGIIQSLIVSSLLVTVFITLLHNAAVTLLAGFQTAIISAMFILTDGSPHILLNVGLAAIIILPLLILLITLNRDISQLYDQDKKRSPFDSERGDTLITADSEKLLLIRYDQEKDALVVWVGVPAGNGETVAQNLVAESNDEGEVTGIVLEHAAELLLPILSGEAVAGPKVRL